LAKGFPPSEAGCFGISGIPAVRDIVLSLVSVDVVRNPIIMVSFVAREGLVCQTGRKTVEGMATLCRQDGVI